MKSIEFVWDQEKDRLNRIKHDGISFNEAKTAFSDDYARLMHDPDHSQQEDRFLLLGLSEQPRLLIVCHCYRDSDSVIRIISARKATKKEAEVYERHRNA